MVYITLKVPLSANKTEFAEMTIKEVRDGALLYKVTEEAKRDELKALKMLLNAVRVSGDPVSKITESLYATRSAILTLTPYLQKQITRLKK